MSGPRLEDILLDRYSKILDMVTSDLVQVFKMFGSNVTSEDLLEEYSRIYDGPTALETVLIREGKMNVDEIQQHHLVNSLFRNIQTLIDERKDENDCH